MSALSPAEGAPLSSVEGPAPSLVEGARPEFSRRVRGALVLEGKRRPGQAELAFEQAELAFDYRGHYLVAPSFLGGKIVS